MQILTDFLLLVFLLPFAVGFTLFLAIFISDLFEHPEHRK